MFLSIFIAHNFSFSFLSGKDCPAEPGYSEYHTGGCVGRNELGIFFISRDDCADRCNQDSSCISFEYLKPEKGQSCQLSTSCKYSLTVNDSSDFYCFYEKDGKV